MSIRVEQIQSLLKREISQVLQRRLADPRIRGLVSVTAVRVSPDLAEAYVSVSVIPAQYESRTLQGLRAAAGHIRARLGEAVAMRSVPRLDFRLDASLKKQAEIFQAMRQAEEQDRQRHPETAAADPAEPPAASPDDVEDPQ